MAQITNNYRFERVGLIGKPDEPRLPDTLGTLHQFLQQRGLDVWFGPNVATALQQPEAERSLSEIGRNCDLALAIGGDGTLLDAARGMAEFHVPLLGINLGRLGFLVDISPEDFDALESILLGNYSEHERFMLEADNGSGDKTVAFNDVVLYRLGSARMIEFDTWIDDQFAFKQRSDGIIISTPTGSTAYSLAGGGPLLMPGLEVISLVPICPHTLSNRPIVIDASAEIRIHLSGRTVPEDVSIACDGQTHIPFSSEHPLRVRRHAKSVRLLHPPGHDHLALLRAKLDWGGRTN